MRRMVRRMTYDEIIEAMAKAIWETNSPGVEWANISGAMQAIVYVEARAALSALRALAEERGYRLMVPVEEIIARHKLLQDGVLYDEDDEIATGWNQALSTIERALSAAPDPTKEPTP